jgi:hypothetical protein
MKYNNKKRIKIKDIKELVDNKKNNNINVSLIIYKTN